MFETFAGNAAIVGSVRQMIRENRLPQTLLLTGADGVGKATLARLIAASLHCKRHPSGDPCGECTACRRILAADLFLPEYRELFDDRARMPPDRRRDSPLVISTHPDFLIFPPDGPLPQIAIEQVRRLKEYAQFASSEGGKRVFVVDHADRIDLPAANSLLKILEEPPAYLTIIVTAENAYDLLPTIRSRCVPFYFAPLSAAEMERFLAGRKEISAVHRAKLAAWAQGSPGRALSIDAAAYEKRRLGMLALLRSAVGGPFGELIRHTEAIARSKQEKLELQLDALYSLLSDLARLSQSAGRKPPDLVNQDIRDELTALSSRVDFRWLEEALQQVDDLDRLARRNVQKQIALEAIAVGLRDTGGRPEHAR